MTALGITVSIIKPFPPAPFVPHVSHPRGVSQKGSIPRFPTNSKRCDYLPGLAQQVVAQRVRTNVRN